MARTRRIFRCRACGWESPAPAGRCAQCREWNSLDEVVTAVPARGAGPADGRAVLLQDVADDPGERLVTGIPELDRVLGGGLVAGSLVLVGGEPGIGKSTLMLQAAARLAAAGGTVAYICGEESPRQVKVRAARLGLAETPLVLIPETSLDRALATAQAAGAAVTIVDSIQAVFVEGVEARAGGPAQLAEAGTRLVHWAKAHGIATLVTGHVTKTGDIAGPRLLEHLVDAVLYFEGAEGGAVRVLRAVKNRFGATDEVGVFEMTGEGLRSVENASSVFLDAADRGASGCAVTAVIEGSRPIAIEVQALAVPSYLATPRRIASGLEIARLHLLLAVLARRGGLQAGSLDVVATVAGGMRLKDSGADLAILCALASAIRDTPMDPTTAFLGEVALSGAIRPVQGAGRRLAELARLGFTRCVGPATLPATPGIEILAASSVRAAIAHALAATPPSG